MACSSRTDRFGCSVLGVDLLPVRIEIASTLTERAGLRARVSYRLADATDLPVDDASFAQVWMLDVGIHVRDKRALFAEIRRVLRPGGLLVMHDQTGPLPRAMAPATTGAPFIAPSLPQLIRYVEAAELRILSWRDTSAHIVEFWQRVKERLGSSDGKPSAWGERLLAMADAYIETPGLLTHLRKACSVTPGKDRRNGREHAASEVGPVRRTHQHLASMIAGP